MAQIESVLKLNRLAFSEISYNRNTDINVNMPKYNISFRRDIHAADGDENSFKVTLTADIASDDETKSIQMRVVLNGYFSCKCEDETLKKTLVTDNSVAIMFPYLRSQVTVLSAQPDLLPIVLPPINIAGAFSKQEEQSTESN